VMEARHSGACEARTRNPDVVLRFDLEIPDMVLRAIPE
jgi:hypothetical protein